MAKSSDKLRCGVIGVGMGKGHVKGYQSHKRAEVVALADVDPNRLKAAATELGIARQYTDPLVMLRKENLDVVSVATPNKFHKPLTLAALEAGCHVLCEKPMAMNAAEAREMADTAEKAKRRLMINFSYRFTEQSWALKGQVASGILGDIYFARTIWHRRRGLPGFGGWFGKKDLAGGGPLIDLGVHRIDLALWLMGYPRPVWVMGGTYDPIASELARKQGREFDVEDLAVAMVRFDNGAMLEIEASWAANIAEREMMETRLFGTRGGLVQRNLNEGYAYEAELYTEREGCQFDMKLHPPVPGCPSAYYHFIESILNNTPHVATAQEGLTVMELLDAIYASAAAGEPIHVGAATPAAGRARRGKR
jgi:predicted dehydrogenase